MMMTCRNLTSFWGVVHGAGRLESLKARRLGGWEAGKLGS